MRFQFIASSLREWHTAEQDTPGREHLTNSQSRLLYLLRSLLHLTSRSPVYNNDEYMTDYTLFHWWYKR